MSRPPFGRRGRVLGRRRPNRSTPPTTCSSDGAGDRPQDFGRLHGRRRATGEQSRDLVRADPPRFAVREQIAHRHEIAAVRRQVPARRLLEVRERARRMRSELGIVEFGEFDGLQCEVPRHLDRPVPVEPAIHLLAPPAFLPCERGGLGSPAKLRVQPITTFMTNTGGRAFGVEPARSPTPSGRTYRQPCTNFACTRVSGRP